MAQATVTVCFEQSVGPVKPMHAVNNGPQVAGESQKQQNFEEYKALKLPYARNHDANLCYLYGGPHTVDVHSVFPDFNADEQNADNYDFACTDKYTAEIFAAGTKVFYRLGAAIEHTIKKYHILPPKDFYKWARICEHIILHYTQGWGNGFRYDIEYWEIWNEPDLRSGATWGGTREQFFDLYEVTAKHLKKCFPHLKIGGPAIAHDEKWAAAFLGEMQNRKAPLDFFSWHIYCVEPAKMVAKAQRIRKLLDENGFAETESINNEWNYVKGWTDDWTYSLETMASMKGAAFTGACMLACQTACVDMLMYYDARVGCSMNGLFDPRTLRPLKGYYVFQLFSRLYELGTAVRTSVQGEHLYAVAAKDGHGEQACMIVCYTDDDTVGGQTVRFDLGNGQYEVFMVDENHSGERICILNACCALTLGRNSAVLLKKVRQPEDDI